LKNFGLIILLLSGYIRADAECTTQIVGVPIVQSISVDFTGNVTICWEPVVDASGIASYTIFMINPGTGDNDSIASVLFDPTMPLIYCYTLPAGHVLNNSDNEIIELSVAAVDVCASPNISAVGANYHNTILLKDTFDVCNSKILLEWNAYDDYSSGLNVDYEIYLSINNGTYNLISNTLVFNYQYLGVVQGSTYEFYVRAVENNGVGPFSSSSNDVLNNSSSALKIPTFNYFYSTNVIDSTQIIVQFTVDTAADINSYRIKRATSLAGNYETVGSVIALIGMEPIQRFTDNNDITANVLSYYYKVFPVNICGVEDDAYNFGNTILVDVVSSPIDAINTISFTPYNNWDNGVERYELYRAVAGVWESSPVAVFPALGDGFIYEDDITSVFYGDGEFCYKVKAYERGGIRVENFSSLAISQSNEGCALHEPLLYVPNAFVPQRGSNAAFIPVLTFADPASYLFQVYNKWGQVIFETTDVSQAWNGKVNNSGAACQQDVYIYLVEFNAADGKNYSKRGKVTLLR
jgi:hypothetical protein